jgi:hypothetical protein
VFIRFVTGILDIRSGRRQGVFEAGGALRRSGRMSANDLERLDELRDWFVDNLPGYIVYEDDHQVVAYPFADTPC